MSTPHSALVATSVEIDPALVNGVALGGADGFVVSAPGRAVAGLGCACEISLDNGFGDASDVAAVSDVLAAVTVDETNPLGRGAVIAMGALPYDRAAPASMCIPELTVQRLADGRAFVTVISSIESERDTGRVLAAMAARVDEEMPTAITSIDANPTPQRYEAMVGAATQQIRAGSLRKVVLSRGLRIELDRPLDLRSALRRLREREPSCTLYSVPTPTGRFIGASPELLIRRRGTRVTSHPLAGTTALTGTEADQVRRLDALTSSTKIRDEHVPVALDIAASLAPLCQSVEIDEDPSVVLLRSVAHLGTKVTARIDEDGPSALALLGAIAPTAAVGGIPREPAGQLVAELEQNPRGHWAGAIGFMDARGDGEFVLGIRGAFIEGRTMVLRAGAGIVAASDPVAEREETGIKLTTVLDALCPGLVVPVTI